MAMQSPSSDFGKRLRVARVWAGFTRQDEFGDALSAKYPDWPVRRVVKRVENGERTLNSDEIAEWADRVSEFTGVPRWFLISGWDGAKESSPFEDQLAELRAAVERHELMLLEPIRNLPAPFPDEDEAPAEQAATTLRRAAQGARRKQAERPEHKPATRTDRKR